MNFNSTKSNSALTKTTSLNSKHHLQQILTNDYKLFWKISAIRSTRRATLCRWLQPSFEVSSIGHWSKKQSSSTLSLKFPRTARGPNRSWLQLAPHWHRRPLSRRAGTSSCEALLIWTVSTNVRQKSSSARSSWWRSTISSLWCTPRWSAFICRSWRSTTWKTWRRIW